MRLKLKLLLPIIIGLLVVLALVQWYWVPNYIDHEREQFKARNVSILESLNPSLIRYLASKDYDALYATMEHLLEIHEGDWLSLNVVSEQGRRLFPLRAPQTTFHDGTITLSHYIEVYGDKSATISIVADWQKKEKLIVNAVTQIGWLAMTIFALIMGAGVFWQSAWITTPLLKLKTVAHRLAQGKFDMELPNAANDEIGDLTKAFGTMQQELQDAHDKLESTLHEAQERDVRQSAILNSVEDGIITVNETGNIESFSKGAQAIFMTSAEESLGKHFSKFFVEKRIRSFDRPEVRPKDFLGAKHELEAQRPDGTVFDAEFSMVEMSVYGEISYMGVIRDITVYKETERMKDSFVSTVSHELRTPLTAIKGSLDLLQFMPQKDIEYNLSHLLEVSRRNVDRLCDLIDDILDISKLQSDSMDFSIKSYDIMEFIQETVDINQGYAQSFKNKLVIDQCPENMSVLADHNRLMQALSNIMSNAVKWSPEESEIKINVTSDEDSLLISVTDNGPGVPEDFADKLFDKFTQHDVGNTRQVGSTGLGLHITKGIIEHMNGTVGFHNEANGGATFYIILPLSPETSISASGINESLKRKKSASS